MSLVPAGYKLLLQKPNGEIFYTEELGGYDLMKFIARASLIEEISETLEMEITNAPGSDQDNR